MTETSREPRGSDSATAESNSRSPSGRDGLRADATAGERSRSATGREQLDTEPAAASGNRHRVVSGGRLGAIARQRRRAALLALAGAALLAAAMLTGICLGENTLSPGRALNALFLGTGDRADVLLVGRFRTPRVLSAVIAGAGLAVAGAVLQRVARNPLASPDVVGITGGASLGATAAVALGLAAPLTPLAALGGGLCAATILGLLALQIDGSRAAPRLKGGISPIRLVLVGLAVQAGLTAAVNLFIVRFPAELASSALHWTTGSLYGRNWNEAIVGASATAVALIAVFALHRRAAVLDLGDDAAGALGVQPGLARLQLLAVAVVLASLAVALTGPVGFVALAVPHLVRRLAGPPTAGTLALNALAGALLLLTADLVAQHALPFDGLPVGVVTATLGAPCLLALLARQNRPDPRTAR
ncbi:iron ABC transporter permease [Glycomyces luteolus]|uniref:Iron ABC transporter permease n=1 Tax=Glycomyces luteolus TaxID=2670330 RepID=A0A9X3T380_9ACTN|nr:iron ABC transporter permease [Glycomyces luteolus]MDA1359680.1 iron ABC transporter permease [Glycomyces luteolus]